MQNWNQWQLPAATVTAPMPQPPIGFAAPGADPMATMQSYMQYYNQPAPSGYTAEQWAAAQQQNWVQWQTWQQQYQQWQAQYGEKYQETMKQMSSQGLPGLAQVPSLSVIQPPPLPKEDTSVKPPLPPESGAYGIPPPHQNNLPLFPSKQSANPPLPPGQPPLPPESSPTSANDGNLNGKRGATSNVDTGSAKKLKIEDDELTEAEKTFDAQFKQWEEQFNKWKQQNANHPDKTQYKQYEAKWTSWREKLIERREQMRRKREQQKQTAAKAEAEKNKSMSGDDKILNILSSTENQGLINNLLGIGKTLGLTGKQEVSEPPPGHPAAPSMVQPPSSAQNPMAMGAPTMTANMNQAAWAAQQWAAQYNAGMNMTNYGAGYQQSAAVSSPANGHNALGTPVVPPNFNQPPGNFNQPLENFSQSLRSFNQAPGNFNQPPPGMPAGAPNMSNMPPNLSAGGPNFSQPPPTFSTSDNTRQQSSSGQEQRNSQGSNSRSFRNDGGQGQGAPFSRDSMGSGNDRFGFETNRFSGPPPKERSGTNRGGQFSSSDDCGRDGSNKDFGSGNQCGSGSENFRRESGGRDFSPSSRSGNDFRSNDRLGNDNDGFGFDRDQGDRFDRDADRQEHGKNRSGSDRESFNLDRGDRFGSNNDRFSSGNERFGSGNDRFGFANERLNLGTEQLRPGADRFGSSNDRFSCGNDKFGSASGDRFSLSTDRPGLGGDRLGQSNDKFNRPPPDRFDSRDGSRDSFGSNSKNFGRNNQFDPPDDMPPELKKLMEKRRAAMDVFKPSNFGSFLDTDRNSTASSSLSESFRKITGDSPFSSRITSDFGNKDSFAPRGPPPGPSGSGNFDSPRDTRPGDNLDLNFRGPGDIRNRGTGDFTSRGNEFCSHGPDANSGPRRSGDFAPKTGNEFDSRIRNDFEPRREFESSRNENTAQRDKYGSPDNKDFTGQNPEKMLPSMRDGPPPRVGDEGKDADENLKRQSPVTNESNAATNNQKVPPLQMPPWMNADFDNDDIVELPTSKLSKPPMPPFSNADKDNSLISADSGSVSVNEKSHDTPEESKTKSDALPFMGENDPKPEDLNMEPPPELPNLGPVIKGSDSPFEQHEGDMSVPFGPPSGDFDARQHFDGPFGPRGMQMGPRGPMPPFGPRGPNDARFPPYGPRGIGGPSENMGPMGPFGPHGPNSGTFGPRGPPDDRFNLRGPFGPRGPGDFGPRGPPDFGNRGPSDFGPRDPNDKQFGPRGLTDRPFGPRGPLDRSFGPNDGPFGPRIPNDGPFEPRGPNDGPSGPRGPNDGPFRPRGPNDGPFESRGPNDGSFGPRGPNDGPFGPRGPIDGPFGPRGPNDAPFEPHGLDDGPFGPHGPNDGTFGPRGPNDGPFGPRGPNDGPFGPRGPNDGPFGPRGPNDGPFGPRGPNDGPFGPRGPNDGPFGPRGPNDGPFGPRDQNDGPFGPRGPNDGPFGRRGPNDGPFGPRGPNDGPFGPRGPNDGSFGPCGPNDGPFGPRGPNDGPSGSRGQNNAPFEPRGQNDGPFGPRGPKDGHGPNDAPFGSRASNDSPLAPRPPFGSNTFGPRGNSDGQQGSIPSLMSFKFDKPKPGGPTEVLPQENDEFAGDRSQDLPPAFRAGDEDLRAFAGNAPQGDADRMDPEIGSGPNKPNSRGSIGPDWKQPFIRNKFGDFDQRTGPGDHTEGPPIGPGDAMEIDRDRKMPLGDLGKNRPSFGPEERMVDKGGQNIKSRGETMSLGFNESSGGFNDKHRGQIANFMNRRSDDRRRMRGGPQKEFCIEKQFNYNHSGGVPDEILTDHTPAKVIDYAHAPRVVVKDYVTPAQCFDYGHGRLKPNVQDHEIFSKQDFSYWVENEHNLKEYMDRMKVYEADLRALNRGIGLREPDTPVQHRQPSWTQEERRSYERDRRSRNDRSRRDRDIDDYRDREKERESRDRGRLEREREWERISSKHREDRSHQRRSTSRDRTRERPEKIKKESNKENNKDDERSKGNVSGQEISAKKPDEPTSEDNSQEEVKNEEPEVSPNTMELPNAMEPPKTMELPKTPNFTMIDDLLCPPGRQNRPPKIVVILRGPPGSGKSFVAKLIKDKEVEQGGSAPRILSLDDYFLTEKEVDTVDDNGKKITTKDMVYEYEEAMEPSYITSLVKAFKKNITDGFFNFIILDSINEKISDYEEMWSFAKTKGFRVYVCEMEMDVQICLKRNIHQRTEDEVNRIVDYFEPTPSYHQKLDVTSMLQEEAIEEVHMEDSQEVESTEAPAVNDDSQDSQDDCAVVSKWERMEANDKLDRLDGLAKRKNEGKPQTMEDFLQVPDYYNMEDTSGKKRVRWADLEERKEQEKMRAVGFVVGQTNWDRMMDPTKGGSALTRTKYI